MNLFLLQMASAWKEDNPMEIYIILGAVGFLIIAVIITNLVRGSGGSRSRSSGGGGTSGRFPLFAMYRLSKTFGLNREQAKILEFVLKSGGINDPESAVFNTASLDKNFKRAFRQIENSAGSEEEAQQKLALLFSVRNIIDIYNNTRPASAASINLSPGMAASLTMNQNTYPVKIISAKNQKVLVECPRTPTGGLLKIPSGTKVNLSFFSKSNKGFSFESQVTGTGDTSHGHALQLVHNRHAKPMVQRRFRRRQSSFDCDFFMVNIEENRGKKPPKMSVDPRRLSGSITDISIGGCAIKSPLSISAGSRLKIEFGQERGSLPVAVLGQVLRTNRSGFTSIIIHIKFLKVPRKAMNLINSMVFEYGD